MMLKCKVSEIQEKWKVLFHKKAQGKQSFDAVLKFNLFKINKQGLTEAEFES